MAASIRRLPARGVPNMLLPPTASPRPHRAAAALAAVCTRLLATHRATWHLAGAEVTTLSGKETSTGDNVSLLDNVLAGGVVAAIGATLVGIYRESQETSRRKNSPLHFPESCSQIEFSELVTDVAQHTPRVKNVVVTGMTASSTLSPTADFLHGMQRLISSITERSLGSTGSTPRSATPLFPSTLRRASTPS